MSSYAETEECPRCGGQLEAEHDSSNPYGNYGTCIDCGYGYSVKVDLLTMEELNELRKDWELPPLTERREAKTG